MCIARFLRVTSAIRELQRRVSVTTPQWFVEIWGVAPGTREILSDWSRQREQGALHNYLACAAGFDRRDR